MAKTTNERILWHGSEHPDASSIEARSSALPAVWLTGDPAVAALYAGPDGHVHGFVPAPGTRLLRADGSLWFRGRPSGSPLSPPNHPDAGTWAFAKSLLEDMGYDIEAFDSLDAGRIADGWMPPLGPEGQPSWEGLLQDFCDLPEEGRDVLSALGFDGIVKDERPDLALGDRRTTTETATDPVYRELVSHLRARGASRSMSVAVFDPSSLVHVRTLAARDVAAKAVLGGERSSGFADLAEWYADPVVPGIVPTL